MNNNKNRMRDREKTNAELRKMEPRDNATVGMVNDQLTGGVNDNFNDKARTKRKKKKES